MRQLCDGLAPGGSGTSPGGKWRLIRGGGQPPGSVMDFEVQLTSSLDETVVNPMANAGYGSGGAGHDHSPRVREDVERPVPQPAGSRSTRQSVGLHSGAVKVYAVSVDVTRKQVDRPVSTVHYSIDVDVNGVMTE